MIVSAFYSGLRGGKLFAEALIEFLEENPKGGIAPDPTTPDAPRTYWIDKLPVFLTGKKDEKDKFDPNESYLDEAIGYTLAAFGFAFQFFNGFALPFPLNLIFLPLTIIEWFLRIQISMEGAKPLV